MKKILIMAMILVGFSSLLVADDKKHITFVNQTGSKLNFHVDVTLNSKDKLLESYTSDYTSFSNNIGSCGDKKYEITITKNSEDGKKIHTIKNGKKKYKFYRKCGETLYVWYHNKQYHVGKHPHIVCPSNGDKDKNILFAHGYHDSKGSFNDYKKRAKEKDWRVFRTSVSASASIAKRSYMLADYINRASEKCSIEDNTLLAVGHSMGGLDLRRIVSKANENKKTKKQTYYRAAKKIKKIYTIATPHKGHFLGGTIGLDDGADDLGTTQMKKFNKRYPYEDFKVDERKVPFTAVRFRCSNNIDPDKSILKQADDVLSDGVVLTTSQVYPNAPYSENIYIGRHDKQNSKKICSSKVRPELKLYYKKEGKKYLIQSKKVFDEILDDSMAVK